MNPLPPHLVPVLPDSALCSPAARPRFGFASPQGLRAWRCEPWVVEVLAGRTPLQLSTGSDARIMFDGMPAQKRGKEFEGDPAEAIDEDRTGALPDALLHHVLSFLPAEEAVRTCVLARRWRHLWKSAPGLRIGCLRDYEWVSVPALRRFVDRLLILRGASPLDTCELRIGDFPEDDDEDHVNCWFRYAIACGVRVLALHVERNNYHDPWLWLDDLPLVSQHLTTLELHCVRCDDSFLDFASCPALEHLKFEYCCFSWSTKISSESAKSLSITDSPFSHSSRLHIHAPNLVSLHLDDFWGRTPVLESMPFLVEAYVRVTVDCVDCCDKLLLCDAGQDCPCEYCSGNIGNGSVLLKGLSRARKLVLISKPQMFIFKRDLRWCPTFSMLKTLLLNDYWCVPDDHRALACILEHSPVLEKLTLQLFSEGPDHKMEMKGTLSSMKRSSVISEHLKIVEIKCEAVDERPSAAD
ncbi:hypothetical protein EJB05_28970, partial [Eragrostis curvula]